MQPTDLFPLISAILVILLAISVYRHDRRNELNRLFIVFSSAIFIWLIGTFMLFIATTSEDQIFWDRFIYIGVSFIPSLVYHFSVTYTHAIQQRKFLFPSYLGAIFFLIISRTDYFVKDLYFYSWGVHTKAQFWHHVFLAWFIAHTLVMIGNLYHQYKTSSFISNKVRQQTRFIYLAFIILFTIGPLAFLPAYSISVYPFPYLSGVLFTGVLAYAIIRYEALNIKITTIRLVSYPIMLIVLIELLSARGWEDYLIRFALLTTILFLSQILIRQAEAEAKRKEKQHQKLVSQHAELRKIHLANMEYISDIAHRLKTPLAIIEAQSSPVAKRSKPQLEQSLQDINRAAHTTAATMRNIVAMGKIDAELVKVDRRRLNLSDLLNRWRPDLKALLGDHKLSTIIEPNCFAAIDSYHLREALLNLIDNARKYSPAGSRVSVTLASTADQIELSVQDEGFGIKRSEIGQIFNRHWQSERHTKQTGSAGLGLSLVKWIVQEHHGEITVTSRQGTGTCFTIKLPAITQPTRSTVTKKIVHEEAGFLLR